jgi:DNA polymerase-3 subunit beta
MSCHVQQEDLSRALNTLQGFIAKKTPLLILTYFLVKIADDWMEISGTDLEVSVSIKVPADVKTPMSFSVPGKMFVDIMRQLPSGVVVLDLLDQARLEIKTDAIEYRINVMSALEFPTISGLDLVADRNVSTSVLSEMIGRVINAASHDESKFHLSGVCIDPLPEGRVIMVATDGHRFGMCTRTLSDLLLDSRLVVPRRSLAELKKVFDESDQANFEVGFGKGYVMFKNEISKFAIRLMNVEYPDYRNAFPRQPGIRIKVSVQELSDALRRMSLVLASPRQPLRVDVGKNSMRICSKSIELGESKEVVAVEGTDKPITVGFCARLLLDTVGSLLYANEIFIEIPEGRDPTKFFPVDDEDSLAMLMPTRIEQQDEL